MAVPAWKIGIFSFDHEDVLYSGKTILKKSQAKNRRVYGLRSQNINSTVSDFFMAKKALVLLFTQNSATEADVQIKKLFCLQVMRNLTCASVLVYSLKCTFH